MTKIKEQKIPEEVTSKRKKGARGKTVITDPNTGELIPVTIYGNSEEFQDTGFVKHFQVFTKAIINDKDMASKAIRLLFWITEQLEYDQIDFYMYDEEVAKELNVTTRTIANWKKTLIQKQIIKKTKPNIYIINPACVAVGKANSLINEWNKYKEENIEESEE